ncbi:LuxR C-terminal-related transcriptional regulator [Streptomyces afghaniensis]|uniref:LuxR C-terminal-related transcriptional regulator n=1 Tax=Streptomyces afghaniensis TaxID=66865 RepID=UPI0027891B6E|nr:LuxR C-terminal-related transcriptional regulator [Streptomyces afghaniensis]MDQ1014233.1 DNA-binding NarL/FixJ family response regulator [Streptomyces afghaniensis]
MKNVGLDSPEILHDAPQNWSPERYRDSYLALFEQSLVCIANLDLEFRITEVNRSFAHQFDLSPGQGEGKDFCELLHPSVQGKLKNELIRLVDGQSSRFADHLVALGAKDAVFRGEMTGIAVRSGVGRVGRILVLVDPEESDSGPQIANARRKLFSPMHARILEGVASGESTVQLATKLFLSRGGVEYHVSSLLRKMKVTNRPALISKSYSLGVFAVGQWPPRVRPEFVAD